jgi:hypothetical protein
LSRKFQGNPGYFRPLKVWVMSVCILFSLDRKDQTLKYRSMSTLSCIIPRSGSILGAVSRRWSVSYFPILAQKSPKIQTSMAVLRILVRKRRQLFWSSIALSFLLCCLDPRFGAYLEDLVTQTLCPRNLVPKGARLKQISDHKKELALQIFAVVELW